MVGGQWGDDSGGTVGSLFLSLSRFIVLSLLFLPLSDSLSHDHYFSLFLSFPLFLAISLFLF